MCPMPGSYLSCYASSMQGMCAEDEQPTSSSDGPAFGPGRVRSLILKPVRLQCITLLLIF